MRPPRYGNTRRRVIAGWWKYQRTRLGHKYVQDCPECQTLGSFQWRPYSNAPIRFANGRSYGQWRCQMYDQCEYA